MRGPRLASAAVLLIAGAAAAAEIGAGEKRSGATFMSAESRAMQADDTGNPGMLWVLQGEQLWNEAAGSSGKSCRGCHGDAASMRGVAARYPLFDDKAARPVDLEARINLCRARHQASSELERMARSCWR